MRFLYGSQNFGYNTEKSDKDWLEITYPTWEDILYNRCDTVEHLQDDGSHLVMRDIRRQLKVMKSGNINGFQSLFSQETQGDISDWTFFFNNRQRIVRMNLPRVYVSNKGCIISMLKDTSNGKNIARAYVFYKLLERLVVNRDEEFQLLVPESRQYREWIESAPENRRKIEANGILTSVQYLEPYYSRLGNQIDKEISNLMDKEVVRLIKKNLY